MKKGFALDSVFLIIIAMLAVMILVTVNVISDQVYDGLSQAIPGEINGFGTVENIKNRTNTAYTSYLLMLPIGLLAAFGLVIKFASSLAAFDSIESFIHFLLSPFIALIIFIIVSITSTYVSTPAFSTIVTRNNLSIPLLTGMPIVYLGVFMFFLIMVVMFARSRDDVG